MKVLVTGHTGFLGSVLIPELKARGHQVTGLSLSGGDDGIACDLTDPEATARALGDLDLDTVIHLAGITSEPVARRDPDAAFRANTGSTWNLFDAVDGAGKFVLGSSAAVYGRAGGILDEAVPIEPVTPYGASRAAAEVVAGQYGRWNGVPVARARLFNLTGPGMPPASLPGLIAGAIATAEAAGEAEVRVAIRNPDSERDFLDVRDAARALALIAEGEVEGAVNVCSGEGVRVGQLVEAFGRLTELGIETGDPDGSEREAEIERLVGSNERLGKETGWRPETTLDDSLEAGLDVFRQAVPG
jgi:nucleoside-diphosphate-sugar epimerase